MVENNIIMRTIEIAKVYNIEPYDLSGFKEMPTNVMECLHSSLGRRSVARR